MNEKVASFIRHIITVAAGWLLAVGIGVPEEALNSIIEGFTAIALSAIGFAGTMFWSFISKGLPSSDSAE